MSTGKKILLVEDEALIAMMEQKQLETYGYSVVTAMSGDKAVDLFAKTPGIDLILMDIDLGPGMDGTQAAAVILGDRDIPVVFLSSHTEPEVVEKTERITSYGYVVKNSGITILDASIKMAFKLFDEKRKVRNQQLELATSNEALEAANEELTQTNEQLAQTIEELARTNAQLTQANRDLQASQRTIMAGAEALRLSEQKFATMFQSVPVAVQLTLSGDDTFHDVNDAWLALMGFAGKDEVIGKTPVELGIREPEERRELLERFKREGSVRNAEIRYHSRSGEWRDALVCIDAIEVNDARYLIQTLEDITERKTLEAERTRLFQISELTRDRLDFALQSVALGAWELDLADHTAWRSLKHDQIFGYDAILPQWTFEMFIEHVIPEDRGAVGDTFQAAVSSMSEWEFECRIRRCDGGERWIWAKGQPRRSMTTGSTKMFGVVQDITDRKRMEEERHLALAKYKVLFDAIPVGVTVADAMGTIIESNDMAQQLLGLDPKEHARRTIDGEEWRIVRPDGSPMPADEFASVRALNEKRLVGNVEMGLVKGGGQTTWISVTAAPLEGNGVIIAYGDITERKLAQDALRRSEADLAEAQRIAKMGNWRFVAATKEVRWSDELHAIFEVDREDFQNSYESFLTRIHPDDVERVQAVNREALEQGTSFEIEYRITTRSGDTKHIREIGYAVTDPQGAVTGLFGTAQDVTERAKAIERLRESEERFSRVFHTSPACQLITTFPGSEIIDVNEAYCRMIEYSREELIGKLTTDLNIWCRPEDRAAAFQEFTDRGAIRDREAVFRTGAGRLITVIASVVPFRLRGLSCVISTVVDITERKRLDEALRESERFMRSTLDSLPEHIAIIDEHGSIIRVNRSWVRFARENGYEGDTTFSGLNYLSICEATTGPDAAMACEFAAGIRDVIAGHIDEFSMEYPCNGPAEERWFHSRVTPFIGEGPRLVIVSHDDITARHRATSDLRDSEERYRSLVEISPDGIFINQQGSITFTNPALLRLLGAADPSQILGKSPYDIIHPESHDIVKGRIARMTDTGAPVPFAEVTMRRLDGSKVYVESTAMPFNFNRGSAILVILRDMTQRRESERALRLWGDAFTHCAHGIAIGAPDSGTIMICNRAFADLHRRAIEDIAGAPIISLYKESERPAVARSIAAADRDGTTRYETFMQRLDGSVFPVQVDLASVRDADGTVRYRVATIHDIADRKNAEEALIASENRYRAIFDGAGQGIVTADMAQRCFKFVNPAMCVMFGYSADEFLDLGISDLHPPEALERVMTAFEGLARGEISSVSDIPCVRKDGSLMYVDISASQVSFDGVPHLLGFFTETTRRVTDQRLLRQSEERYRNLIENSHDLIQSVDAQGRFLFVNRAWLETMGYGREDLDRLTLFDVIHPDFHAHCREILGRIIGGDQLTQIKGIFLTSAGRPLDIEGSAVAQRMENGQVVTNAFLVDVTERRRVETMKSLRLAASERISAAGDLDETLTAILSAIGSESSWDCGELWWRQPGSDVLSRHRAWAHTGSGGTAFFLEASKNMTFAMKLGMPGAVWSKRTALWFGDLSTEPEFLRRDLAAQAGLKAAVGIPIGDRDDFYGAMLFYGKRYRPVEKDLLAALEEIGILVGQFVRRKNLEAALERERQELAHRVDERTVELRAAIKAAEDANRAKSDFLASMSHELRTPLNSIIGFSDIMIGGMAGALTDEQKEYLDDIYDSGKHLLSLINDILDLSKVEAGKMELQRATVSVRDILKTAMTLFKERSLKHGITFTVDVSIAEGEDRFEADERKVKQILFNIISNAIKFTGDGGAITVRADRTVIDGTPAVRFSVTDTGIGISPANQQRLFKPFQQIDGSSTRTYGGTGLGLSISKSYVELHGGSIGVESDEGAGATFYFTIPVAPQ